MGTLPPSTPQPPAKHTNIFKKYLEHCFLLFDSCSWTNEPADQRMDNASYRVAATAGKKKIKPAEFNRLSTPKKLPSTSCFSKSCISGEGLDLTFDLMWILSLASNTSGSLTSKCLCTTSIRFFSRLHFRAKSTRFFLSSLLADSADPARKK